MNRLLTVALTLSLLVVNPAAFADGWHPNNGGHGPNHGYPPHHPVPPPKPYYYRYYPTPHKNNDNKTEWPAYLAGGVILGALLTNMFQGPRPTTYADNVPQTPPSAPQGRRLFRDANGRCYERQTDGYGNELSTELPPSACNW